MILKLLNKIFNGWVTEHKFHLTRKWRFDYANVEKKIAIEIEGGVWVAGRHTRGKGYINDLEKYNQAQLLGWRVFRYTPSQTAQMMDDMRGLLCQSVTRTKAGPR